MNPSDELATLLSEIAAPQLGVIELSLGRMLAALEAFGNPHRSLPPVVHVAGTNGKGSTIAYLRAMCEAAGYVCHVYTSPHLVRFNERIVLAGKQIEDDALIKILRGIIAKRDAHPLTFFEATTLAAFLAFSETKADIVLLEVGMGGRFDATNVIDDPLLSIITPISLDHTEFLGDTLAQIAFEKAGIIKAGCPVVVAPQHPEAMEVIRLVAAQKSSPTYEVQEGGSELPLPRLEGAHQAVNAKTAVLAATIMNSLSFPGMTNKEAPCKSYLTLSPQAIAQGIAGAIWPARLQRLTCGPLASLLPQGWQLYLDGGHNPSAAEQLAVWGGQHVPLHIVCAMTAAKDAEGFLRPLADVANSVHLIDIPNEKMAMPLGVLYAAAQRAQVTARRQTSLQAAIMSILEANSSESGYILICGSLYLAGHVLAQNS